MSAGATIADRLRRVREAVEEAARLAGRKPGEVRLIAVGKRFPADVLAEAYAAGQRDFGENYAAELAGKAATLPSDIGWHMIGPVQRRQVGLLPTAGLRVHTLDRIELVERFERLRPEAMPPFLVQVNIGREPSKSGLDPDATAAFVDDLRTRWPALDLRGLMAIPPAEPTPAASRRWFAALRELGERIWAAQGLGRPELSMGMSDDFAEAIAEGATWVRVGTAIFGDRTGPAVVESRA